jgi:hypothetical protein
MTTLWSTAVGALVTGVFLSLSYYRQRSRHADREHAANMETFATIGDLPYDIATKALRIAWSVDNSAAEAAANRHLLEDTVAIAETVAAAVKEAHRSADDGSARTCAAIHACLQGLNGALSGEHDNDYDEAVKTVRQSHRMYAVDCRHPIHWMCPRLLHYFALTNADVATERFPWFSRDKDSTARPMGREEDVPVGVSLMPQLLADCVTASIGRLGGSSRSLFAADLSKNNKAIEPITASFTWFVDPYTPSGAHPAVHARVLVWPKEWLNRAAYPHAAEMLAAWDSLRLPVFWVDPQTLLDNGDPDLKTIAEGTDFLLVDHPPGNQWHGYWSVLLDGAMEDYAISPSSDSTNDHAKEMYNRAKGIWEALFETIIPEHGLLAVDALQDGK